MHTRLKLLFACLPGLLCLSPGHAQPRADFSGDWKKISAESSVQNVPAGSNNIPIRFIVRQNASRLKITREVVLGDGTQKSATRTYKLPLTFAGTHTDPGVDNHDKNVTISWSEDNQTFTENSGGVADMGRLVRIKRAETWALMPGGKLRVISHLELKHKNYDWTGIYGK